MSGFVLCEEPGKAPIKMWTKGVVVEDVAMQQLLNVASMSFISGHIAVMPDVHWGMGATVGSVIPTRGAIIPAAVGVDIGCGMMAVRTTLCAHDLPDNLLDLRYAIEAAIPHGRTNEGRRGDRGAWNEPPENVLNVWVDLEGDFQKITAKHPKIEQSNNATHLGTLGTGNHFIEMCLDEENRVWFMLHSGSRGVGNKIGTYFIALAKKDMARLGVDLPDQDLAYLTEGTEHLTDYVEAVGWAQRYARENRELMMRTLLRTAKKWKPLRSFSVTDEAVNCHHNFVQEEEHFGEKVFLTRKGAVRAGLGDLGIIPGSMGAKSFIVRGKGNPDSFLSCSHGAGRAMSRREAKRRFTLADHREAVEGVECRVDTDVIDETPAAYKPIDAVMEAQSDLVTVVHTLKQVLCVKG